MAIATDTTDKAVRGPILYTRHRLLAQIVHNLAAPLAHVAGAGHLRVPASTLN